MKLRFLYKIRGVNMKNIANEWCKKHHAILLRCCTNGFYYMNANGDWYISYDEM